MEYVYIVTDVGLTMPCVGQIYGIFNTYEQANQVYLAIDNEDRREIHILCYKLNVFDDSNGNKYGHVIDNVKINSS